MGDSKQKQTVKGSALTCSLWLTVSIKLRYPNHEFTEDQLMPIRWCLNRCLRRLGKRNGLRVIQFVVRLVSILGLAQGGVSVFWTSQRTKLAEEQFIAEDQYRFRNRSEAELKPREEGLTQLADVLESLQVPYFLADGTLLGAVRDADFIPWDDDVGLCMRAEDFRTHKQALVDTLKANGFEVHEGRKRNPKLNIYKFSEKYELTSWRLKRKKRVRSGLQMPSHLLESPAAVLLRGRTYPCPNPAEAYLEHRYGDWKVPRVGRGTHSPAIKTRWSLIKRKIRFFSPQWLMKLARRDFLPKNN